MLQKIKSFILAHKIISILVLLIIIIGFYFVFRNKTSPETKYITEIITKSNITTNITGTGQVEATDTIDLKPKTSGDITYVGVKAGDEVKKGKLLVSLDSRDAKIALLSAQITLDKLIGAPDTLTLLQKQNSLTSTYNSGWNTVSSFITDSESILDDIYSIYGNTGFLGYKNISTLSSSGKDKVNLAESNYYDAKKSIEDTSKLYKSLSRASSNKDIRNLINKAYESSKILSNTVKNTQTAFTYVVDFSDSPNTSEVNTTKASIDSWLSDSNSYVNSLLSSGNSIDEGTQSLGDFVAGADDLDIKEAQLTLQNKQDSYNDCFIYAPFDGVVATLTAQVGSSSGSSVGTLITKQKLATISLNEVDIAKIKLGQKVILTFDAVEDLSLTGEVAEIDSIGTVSQGVVSYNVKISFDLDDSRIKPGMSVSATIITNSAQDVIVVPSSAIKTQNGVSYVQTFDTPLNEPLIGSQGSPSANPPKQTEVTLGLIGNTSTEIISGLKEGDIIVTKTITGSTVTTKSTTPSLLNAVGGSRITGSATGNAMRAVRMD